MKKGHFSRMDSKELKELEELRYRVTNECKKMRQIHIVLLCLNFVDTHPEFVSQIGCFWNTDHSFMVHSIKLGTFIKRRPNTINRNFRSHGFDIQKTSKIIREKIPPKFKFDCIPDHKNWFQRQCYGFTKKTTERQARYWKFHKLIPKKVIKIQSNVSSVIYNCNPNSINADSKETKRISSENELYDHSSSPIGNENHDLFFFLSNFNDDEEDGDDDAYFDDENF